jgi:hypothetical protein
MEGRETGAIYRYFIYDKGGIAGNAIRVDKSINMLNAYDDILYRTKNMNYCYPLNDVGKSQHIQS